MVITIKKVFIILCAIVINILIYKHESVDDIDIFMNPYVSLEILNTDNTILINTDSNIVFKDKIYMRYTARQLNISKKYIKKKYMLKFYKENKLIDTGYIYTVSYDLINLLKQKNKTEYDEYKFVFNLLDDDYVIFYLNNKYYSLNQEFYDRLKALLHNKSIAE